VLRNIVTYLLLVMMLAVAVWLAGRLIGVRQHRWTGTGNPALDAEFDFDRALAQHRRRQRLASMVAHGHRLDLPSLYDAGPVDGLRRRDVGEHMIPLERIVGSVDGVAHRFDRDFRPTDTRVRARLEGILTAMRLGRTLPPIEVYRLHDDYYVYDGHHRVAAARALGESHIAGRVIVIDP
jgi:hypothetical protein